MSVVLGVNQSPLTAKALQKAVQIAKTRQLASNDPTPTPADLVLAIFALAEELSEGKVELAGAETMRELRRQLADLAKKLAPQAPALLRAVAKKASAYARTELIELGVKDNEQLEGPLVDLGSLFMGCVKADGALAELLAGLLGVRNKGLFGWGGPDFTEFVAVIRTASAQAQVKWEVGSTGSVLEEFGINLTHQAKRGQLSPFIGRRQEIDLLMQTLTQTTQNSVLFVGPAGVGKTAIAEGFAQALQAGTCDGKLLPPALRNVPLIQLDTLKLAQAGQYEGELEAVLEEIIQEASVLGAILYVDEIQVLLSMMGMVVEQLKGPMGRGKVRLVASTTPDQYNQYIRDNKALVGRFIVSWVDEPTGDDLKRIINVHAEKQLREAGLRCTKEALSAVIYYATHFITDVMHPRRSVRLLDATISRVAQDCEESDRPRIITPDDVARALHVQKPNIALSLIRGKLNLPGGHIPTPQSIKAVLDEWVIGQNRAKEAVSLTVAKGWRGLGHPRRPLGFFVFAGPTGVGKTELVRALAKALGYSDGDILRLDMSEYQEDHTIARLIGAPPGYVGHYEGGLLDWIRHHPHSVVLIDEVEKAAPSIHELWLQVMDYGVVTTSSGTGAGPINCRNVVFVMTTNLGAEELADPRIRGNEDRMHEVVMEALRTVFPPEFIGRLLSSSKHSILVFDHLTPAIIERIIWLKLEKDERFVNLNLSFDFTDRAFAQLMSEGYQYEFGARPAEGAIESIVEDMIYWLEASPVPHRLKVDHDGTGYTFRQLA